MDLHGDALSKIVGDMDDMETKRSYPSGGGNGGATITITVSGNDSSDEGGATGAGDLPADHDISMCGGGCAMHAGGEASTDAEDLPGDMLHMASGGAVPAAPATPVPAEVDDTRTPPFLRKKKAR